MKKLVIAAAVLAGIGFLAARIASKRMCSMDWEERFARMPDNAPPKWMFRNISEIHDNTDRILELLEGRAAGSSSGAVEGTET